MLARLLKWLLTMVEFKVQLIQDDLIIEIKLSGKTVFYHVFDILNNNGAKTAYLNVKEARREV
jgi:hypothetical protein